MSDPNSLATRFCVPGLKGPQSRAQLLEQDRFWVDRNGDVHDVNEIDASYQLALISWLLQRAWSLGFELEELDDESWSDGRAIAWMQQRPLFRKLTELTGAAAWNVVNYETVRALS